ncbi:hypothetical protein AALO_G00108450 [Alosa alosa]|uniref:SOGA 1/2-like coiled-coil domain-containing protein n=1 Tax=Alosa alosa TaxID=278164 RepID=A0AAV6GRV1_9TELE|nr:hypothetical protein AALO_G00108450 [Alosa alosa]
MAALDLQRGVWVGERPEFDSEMLEWEEQLQDMQRKIEELYNEVVARRGGNDGAMPNQANDITLLPVANKDSSRYNGGCHSHGNVERPIGMNLPAAVGKSCGYQLNNGYSDGYPSNPGMDPTLEILQGYLGHGKNQQNLSNAKTKRKNGYDPDAQRVVSGWQGGRSEEFENRRNQSVHYDSPQGLDYYDQRATPGARPPVRHVDNSPLGHVQQRSLSSDRKSAPLDRKQGSPSVLRKFGAMLQENEGKLLTDAGVVAPSPPPTVTTGSSPISPRRSHARTPSHSHAHARYSNPSPTPPPHSSPKLTPTQGQQRGGQWGERRDRDVSGGRVPVQGGDPATDYWMVEHILNGPSVGRRRSHSSGSGGCYSNGGYYGNGTGISREESGLVELLSTLDIQQQQQRPASRVSHTPPVSRESSPAPSRRSFSRPARPANQRPPSRWASQTGSTRPRLSSHSGPMSRPPSPARKARPANQSFSSYSLHTETVIM